MCQVGVADSSAWHLSAVELRANWDWRIWVDTDDKPPCEDDCSGVTRRDQTADRGRRWCREGRDERQKKGEKKELWETITQPNNYSFARISIIAHQWETFLVLLVLIIPNTSDGSLCGFNTSVYLNFTDNHMVVVAESGLWHHLRKQWNYYYHYFFLN